MASKRAQSQPARSILLTATTHRDTPSARASAACSRVWPPRSKPRSNACGLASTTSTATSACAAPAIMFGTKSLCPGASSRAHRTPGAASKCVIATSAVTPRPRSPSVASMIQASALAPCPDLDAWCRSLSTSRALTAPVCASRCPTSVLFPAST